MKTDLYTKIVLTAIALGIFILIFQNAGVTPITTAQAAAIPAPAPQAVQREVIDVNVVQVNGMDLYKRWVNLTDGRKAGCLPISLEYMDDVEGAFNVNIKDIDDAFVVEDHFFSNRKYIRTSTSE